jgi:hypothetical protein
MAEFVISTERLEQLVASKVEEATRDLQDRLASQRLRRTGIPFFGKNASFSSV